MSIDITESDLHAYLDGQLDAEQEAVVLAYLEAHPEARERLREYAEDKLLLAIGAAEDRGPASREPAESLAARLAAILQGRRQASALRHAAAAVVLLGLGWSGHMAYERYLVTNTPRYVVEAAGAHVVFADALERGAEVPADRTEEMVAWLSERVGQPVDVPSLETIGLELVGGRVLGSLEGPLAGLIYEDRLGYRMTLCVSPDGDAAGPELQVVDLGQVDAGYWSDGEQSYAVIADTTEIQLAAIATEIARASEDRR